MVEARDRRTDQERIASGHPQLAAPKSRQPLYRRSHTFLMREKLYNGIWISAFWMRDLAIRAGLLGPLDAILAYFGPRLIPSSSREVDVALPYGLRMTIPPGFRSYRSYATGVYEKCVTASLPRIIEEGMTVVDLGANIGYYTLLASRLVGISGRVYAFEPEPICYEYLQRNIVTNGCRNVVAVEKAVSNRTGEAHFIASKATRGRVSVLSTDTPSSVVQAVTMDDFFAEEGWPPVGLVKLDIEGSERAALQEMRGLSSRSPRLKLIMELNMSAMRQAGVTPQDVASTLLELGFHKGYIIEQDLKPFSVARTFPMSRAIYNLLLTKE